jgi:A/G-specific adenine glycosylase
MAFVDTIWDYYHDNARDLPWRHAGADGTYDPYRIMLSEFMLQQTQVGRVIPKYERFLQVFPDLVAVADAPLSQVIAEWQGLGYNRRAKFLRDACIQLKVHRSFPDTLEELIALPGIGRNTAAAILVYTFNQPHVFIETNIRSVYIHHFFADAETVSDTELVPHIASTIDTENPREWYWALMDYGSFLKSSGINPSRRSNVYAKQSTFAGSQRQMRGEILRRITKGPQTIDELADISSDPRFDKALHDLCEEKLVSYVGGTIQIAD